VRRHQNLFNTTTKKQEMNTMTNTQTDKPTELNDAGMTWAQRRLFHTLVNDGMIEMNAYTACLSVE